MKKFILMFLLVATAAVSTFRAYAFVRYEEKNPKKVTEMHMTGYLDYPPFGWVDNPDGVVKGKFYTLFQPMLDQFVKDANLKLKYDVQQRTFDDLVQKVRQGDIDFLLGAYYQTETFKGLQLLYPSPLYNPVTVFMLPNRINELKTTDDLKKLKGVRNTDEQFSDFVEKKVAELKPVEVDSAYAMFEKLFTREVDYIISGYYYTYIEAVKLGLQHQIAASKQVLWNIPVFIGVSKTSRYREMISRYLVKYLNDPKNVELLKKSLQSTIEEFEKNYAGTVPPTFGLEKADDAAPESTEVSAAAETQTSAAPDTKTPDENSDKQLDGK